MKKKTRNIIIGVVVVLAAIGVASGNSDTTTTETAAVAENHSFLLDYELQTADVKNGSGDTVIGERAYITIPSDKLAEITGEDLAEFADANVDGKGYNWVSIMTDSGNGIVFLGGNPQIATCAKLSNEGEDAGDETGYWLKSDDGYTYTEADSEAESETAE